MDTDKSGSTPDLLLSMSIREIRGKALWCTNYLPRISADKTMLSPIRVRPCKSVVTIFLIRKLLVENPIFEIVLGIEQQIHRLVARFADRHFDHVAHLVRIGGRADRALVRIEHLELHLGACTQDRAAPASRAERTDRRHREHIGAE